MTPIGHVFLRENRTAFYLEAHARKLPHNLDQNPRVCLLLVNSRGLFWARSLFKGRFSSPPGMRLIGIAGRRRDATDEEKATYMARVGPFRMTKGYERIWKDLGFVCDIQLERVEPVLYPVLTDGLWR